MSAMRQHWMAIPIAGISPFLIAAMVLSQTEHWSNGALGGVISVLLSITCVVGTFMAPIDADGKLEQKPRRARRNR
ncbi:MAG: hypothetical protein QOI19_2766 [Thermoleophilaceae bacterium]|jgi:hypothetical protein|nr:hypothetical protein [Thermoleophilaceae bacterium]